MATSGSWNYSLTAANIIEMAYENLGVIADGQAVSSTQSTLALRRLNVITKQFQGNADMAQGLKVHTRQRVTLFLAKGQQEYTIGPASTDSRATAQYGRTTISANEAAGQTTLSITSNTDTTTYPGTTVTMTNLDIIGIVLNDGTIQWTTISGTPGATATIAVALTVAANAGNYVYWFTSRAQRFPLCEYAALRNSDMIDQPLVIYVEAADYESLPDKEGQGDPICVLIEPLRLNTRITLDYQPQDVTKQIRLTVLYPAEDYDATTDDVAFPQEWFRALAWALALEIAPAFGAQWTESMEMNRRDALGIARELNPQNSSAYFQPDADYGVTWPR